MLQSQGLPAAQDLGFTIGPLKKSNPDKLANRIFCLLNCIGIKCLDVAKVSVNTQDGYARVHVRKAAIEDYAIKAFKEKRAVMDLFDLRLITKKPQDLRVDRFVTKKSPAPMQVEANTAKSPRLIYPNGMEVTAGTPALVRVAPKSQNNIPEVANEHGAENGEPVDHKKQSERTRDFESVSQTSSTTSAVGFEELEEEEEEEENMEDYSETYVIQEKSKQKSRSMQTSEGSSSSCGAECSSHKEPLGASADVSRTSGETSDALSMNGNGHEQGPPTIPPEVKNSSLHRENLGRRTSSDHTETDPLMFNESRIYAYNPPTLKIRRGEIVDPNGKNPYKTIVPDDEPVKEEEDTVSNETSSKEQACPDFDVNVHDMIGVYEALDICDNAPIDEQERTEMVSARTSTHEVGPCFCSGTNFYHRGEKISVPVRNVYFNSGEVVINNLRRFRVLIGTHVCALLNSGGGLVYFGVDPSNRCVKGIPISHNIEDALRIDIDTQVQDITPLVPTSAYKVNFAKVMFETGHLMPDVRVLEMEISPPCCPTRVLCAQTPGHRPGGQDESTSLWETPRQGYRYKDYRYIWKNNKVNTAW